VATTVVPAHIIAQGPPNPGVAFTFLFTFHLVVNPNGDVVVERAELREDCGP
jgi:hypothetical protein